jgi:hypothetical protein
LSRSYLLVQTGFRIHLLLRLFLNVSRGLFSDPHAFGIVLLASGTGNAS